MSFDRQAVIHNLYISDEMGQAIGKMEPAELREDLRQEMFVVLCKMPEATLKGLHERGELKWYMVRVMVNMIKTDRSTFYNTYRKKPEALAVRWMEGKVWDDDNCGDGDGAGTVFSWRERAIAELEDDAEDWHQRISDIVDDLDPYEAGLLKLYADMGNSCKPVASATGIPERAIRFAVARAKEKVKTKLRQAC